LKLCEDLKINGVNNVIIADKGVGAKDDENTISWESLTKTYGSFDTAKINCDGLERVIAPYIKEILKVFIEWDNEYTDLVSNLHRNGYRVKVKHTLKNLGFIYAIKYYL